MPPANRCFARLDKFECECPNCGHLISTLGDRRPQPTRSTARRRSKHRSAWALLWNPYTQRLTCPWCDKSFHCGVVLFPIKPGQRRVLVAPSDTTLTPRHELEQRQQVGGWYAQKVHEPGDPVNLVLDRPCSCPDRGWAPSCPVHGDPAHGAPRPS
jgi:hypothetical protein